MSPGGSRGTIRVTVFGAAGRMGRAVIAALAMEPDIEVVHAVDVEERADLVIGEITTEADAGEIGQDSDVWVDVSLAAAAHRHAMLAATLEIPILIGATGFSEVQKSDLDLLTNANVIAPNLSLGVNVLFDLVKRAAKTLGPGYDAAIFDSHHKHKLDRPSGTARKLAEAAREGGADPETVSVRIGEIVGEHRIVFATEGEVLELYHRAESRMAFAKGVAPAVRFLAGRKSGSYTMADVLGL